MDRTTADEPHFSDIDAPRKQLAERALLLSRDELYTDMLFFGIAL